MDLVGGLWRSPQTPGGIVKRSPVETEARARGGMVIVSAEVKLKAEGLDGDLEGMVALGVVVVTRM